MDPDESPFKRRTRGVTRREREERDLVEMPEEEDRRRPRPYESKFAKRFTPTFLIVHDRFGVVFTARDELEMKKYCLKRVEVEDEENAIENAKREPRIIKAMKENKYFIQIEKAWMERPPEGYQPKMDRKLFYKNFCSDGGDALMVRPTMSLRDESYLQCWMYEIADGMAFLHKKNFVHLNLTPSNIYLSAKKQPDDRHSIVIAGFSHAKVAGTYNGASADNLGEYKAPEMSTPFCDQKIDVYSYGTICYEMLHNAPARGSEKEFFARIQDETVNFFSVKEKEEFLRGCLAKNPHERWSFEQVKECFYLFETSMPYTRE
ncbi:unnamed protein product [Caenorhabditis auriculariae]|uniref:Protein kinase domain-containing protein n=1 Tax=Caenorhabditis auriculariae TaxID=2777116 RepID=A0A8S1H892_9PELO|nr:unnamed protein product [Caenorhabditis auriculariae]